MKWHSEIEEMVACDAPLSERTTFRIGGRAAFLVTPADVASFARAYKVACASGLPVRVLGYGSNLLVADEGVPGIVLSTSRLCKRGPVGADESVRVGAGASLHDFVRWSARSGLSGLEFMAGIPGSVGGAVVMNAGGRDWSIGEVVRGLWCVSRDGRLFRCEVLTVSKPSLRRTTSYRP